MELTHILFTAIPAWGHIRPFCILAARLAKEHQELALTLLLPANTMQKAEDELSSELRNAEPEIKQRVRILSCAKATSINPFDIMKNFVEAYPTAYKDICAGKPIICIETGKVYEALPPPVVVIADYFSAEQFVSMREITGKTIPIFSFVTGHAASNIRMFGPEFLGGVGDLSGKMDAMAQRLGITIESPGETLYRAASGTGGTIVKLPGVPEMYDYEFYPQILPFKLPLSMVVKGAYEFLKACDGVIAVNAHCWEQTAIDAMKLWYADWNKKVYAIGPLLPASLGLLEQSTRGSDDIKEFLDDMIVKKGEKSVVLISFGTTFWPSDPTYLEEVVEAMIEKEFPFILCHASPFAKVTDELVEKVKASGIALLTKWCPQQYILDHPATGWFLSHCGNNSVTEALGSGVPMIAWPFEADQPATALQLTSLNLAIELLQVRVGEHAVKPLRRNDKAAAGTRQAVGAEIREVIDLCRGPKGNEMRRNVELIKSELRKAWDVDGPARREIHSFLSTYTGLETAQPQKKQNKFCLKTYLAK